jgi:hypothetical protein
VRISSASYICCHAKDFATFMTVELYHVEGNPGGEMAQRGIYVQTCFLDSFLA